MDPDATEEFVASIFIYLPDFSCEDGGSRFL
jgi:hypothetical protein